ncbi:MAG TPA: A/G-specific adenine glycosylase [Alphaproteobacteria bacterium]|nr:A/G-specific adenine glycosylase [Alphaproteobacteria bacterium]HNS44848.1 A/G-specific adenine glycosylase [Alphaproteobacteria bacterium]
MKKSTEFQEKLLVWYDRYRRDLPWRAKKGKKPDPYHVWLSEIMLQQTTVPAVKSYFKKFIDLWPTVKDLAAADPDRVMHEWAGLGYYARARNLLKCANEVVREHGGAFPNDEKQLIKLSGIGPYTAAAIAAIAYNKEVVVVDGNVERIVSRLFAIETPFPKGKKDVAAQAVQLYEGIGARAADLPQALMDLGSMVCTPKSPKCGICAVADFCMARVAGTAEQFPMREKKQPKLSRAGQVYWIETKDGIVVEKRPVNRMLGGMLGLPTTDWDHKTPEERGGSIHCEKGTKIGEIYHVFTHFALKLDIIKIVGVKAPPSLKENQYILPKNGILDAGFPSLFKKVVVVATGTGKK